MPKAKTTTTKKRRTTRNTKKTRFNVSARQLFSLRGFAVVLIFAALGAALVLLTRAAVYDANASCGKRVSGYTYRVPFGNAVWNQPVCNLPRHPQSADYASRFYNWSNLNDGSAAGQKVKGRLGIGANFPAPVFTDPEGLSGLFSRNVYLASEATTRVQVQTSVYPSNLDGDKWEGSTAPDRQKYLPDTTIPWNPAWRTGEGGDNEIVILDDVTGKGLIYGISGYKRDLAAVTQCGPFGRERICTYNVNIGRDPQGNLIDYRTYEGSTGERGGGISYYATFVTPDEIAAGEIRHAMGVAIPNTAVGPICTKAQQGTAAEGKTCGTAVAPAAKVEWGGEKAPKFMPEPYKSLYTQDKLIPEGMRFALDINDAYIENWINSRADLKSNPRKAETARIFARALRDYGIMIVDTSGNGAGIQSSGMVNPKTREKWKNLGITSDADDNLLDGLIKQDKLYVVDPPTMSCKDGTQSKYFCQYNKGSYPVSTQSPSTSTSSNSPTGNGTSTSTNPTTPNPTPTPTPSSPTSTVDFIPPSVPADLKPSLVFDWSSFRYTIALNWKPSTDDRKVTGYVVKRNGQALDTTTQPAFSDSKNLESDKRYTYTVQARDAAGNLSPAASVSAEGTCFLIWCSLK